MQQNDLKIGDTIKCSKDECVEVDIELNKLGYTTDYIFEKDGEHGYWIVIKGVGRNKDGDRI